MELSTEELAKYIVDPNKNIQYSLNALEYAVSDGIRITEATNPFVKLMGVGAINAANAVTSTMGLMRKMYPSLGVTTDDLLPHISDEEVVNMFSVPAVTSMVFYLNVKDLKSTGYRPEDGSYVSTVLPIGTEVIVTGLTFTLLNEIHIRLYDNGTVFAEQQVSDSDIGVNDLGILPSGIVSFETGESWVVVETNIRQVKRHVINKDVIVGEGYSQRVQISDKYYFSSVTYNQNLGTSDYSKLAITHSKDFIDPATPTVYVTAIGSNLTYNIPDVYLLNGSVSGNVRTVIYETNGKVVSPIHKFAMSEYTVNVPNTGATLAEASIKTINLKASSRESVDGGSNGMTVQELKDSIIMNTMGDIDVPVTVDQVRRVGRFDGFELFKAVDVLSYRVFVASKVLPRYESELIYTRPDIFFNSVGIIPDSITDTSNIHAGTGFMVIKSGTVFKSNNGVITPVTDTELVYIDTLQNVGKAQYLENNPMFYTPYHYVMESGVARKLDTRVYDLDTPVLKDLKIINKNTNIVARVNIDQYAVRKTHSGYDVIVTLVGNDNFSALNPLTIKAQLEVEVIGGSKLLFNSNYDPVTNTITFSLETDLYITADNTIRITNGKATISNVQISLESRLVISLYTTDPNVMDNSNFLLSSIDDSASDITVFDAEQLIVTLGTRIDHIWTMAYTTYTDRKYVRHTVDKPKVYADDVYDVDPLTGSILRIRLVDGAKETYRVLLHSAGDPVLDSTGEPVLEYSVGDLILDNNSVPTIDSTSGVVRNVDVMMLEYEYKIANTDVSNNYISVVRSSINQWLLSNLPSINKRLLDNTEVLFKSHKSVRNVDLITLNSIYSVPYKAVPKVDLYVVRKFDTTEIETLSSAIGYIIHDSLDNVSVSLGSIRDSIISELGSDVVGVKITGLNGGSDSEVFTVNDKTTRMTLGKKLVLDSTNSFVVKYDFNLSVVVV